MGATGSLPLKGVQCAGCVPGKGAGGGGRGTAVVVARLGLSELGEGGWSSGCEGVEACACVFAG